jgi:hypothetical protein
MGLFSIRTVLAALLVASGLAIGTGTPASALPLATGKQAAGGQAHAMTGDLVQRTGGVSFHFSTGYRPRHYGWRHHGYRHQGWRDQGWRHQGWRPVHHHYRPVYRHRPVHRVYRHHGFQPVHYGYRPVYRPRTVCRVTHRRVWSSYYRQVILRPVRVCSRGW